VGQPDSRIWTAKDGPAPNFAKIYAASNNIEKAFDWLRKAYDDGSRSSKLLTVGLEFVDL
jgi:hypothetical protein